MRLVGDRRVCMDERARNYAPVRIPKHCRPACGGQCRAQEGPIGKTNQAGEERCRVQPHLRDERIPHEQTDSPRALPYPQAVLDGGEEARLHQIPWSFATTAENSNEVTVLRVMEDVRL